MIELKNVSKYYYKKGVVATGFSKVNLKLELGEFVAITGESGSGKSTLLNVISGLDTYEEGEMYINGEETSHYIEKDFEEYRRKNIGNIYQNFNLINSYTVYQNIALVLMLNGEKNIKPRVLDLIKKVDLYKFRNTKVSKLSGGQKQRVAIARALAKDVPVIIADEPTGNLDKRSAQSVMKILSELSKDKLVIVVTHNYDQVEEYVTRRIVMHDGRILEDNKIKKTEKVEKQKEQKIKNINIFNEIRLGVRNTFNIIPKFILLFLVFAFITGAIMSEYALLKKEEVIEKTSGYNYIFRESDAERIVLKKNNKTPFTSEEIEKIRNINYVDRLIENDLLLDTQMQLSSKDQDVWLYANILPLSILKGDIDYGTLPEDDYQVVVRTRQDDYLLYYERDNTIEKEYVFYDNNGNEDISIPSIKITGIQYDDSSIYVEDKVYVSDAIIEKIQSRINKQYSKVKIRFQGKLHDSYEWMNQYNLVPTPSVPMGEAYISDSYNYSCPNYNCQWQQLEIIVDNLYYSDKKPLTISQLYNKDNLNRLISMSNYNKDLYSELYEGQIYINNEDYDALFNKETYQMSIFVDDIEHIDSVNDELQKMDIKTLKIMDTYIQNGATEVVRIIKTVITLIVVVTLFFISYFIIKIILKSRNSYYSIIRMLGGSRKVTRSLLIIELVLVAILSYITFIILEYLNLKGIISVSILNDVYKFFTLNDYILLFIIVVLMAFLSSVRYARKLFKDSVMQAFREEV